MEVLIALILPITVISFVAFALYNYRKEWGGVWRGRKVHIVRTLRRCKIFIDGKLAIEKSGHTRHLDTTWQDPIHGDLPIQLIMQSDSNGSIANYQIVIDGEIVHLVQAPTNWLGHAIPNSLPTLKDSTTVEGTRISDPRYAAAERLFKTLETELGEDVESIAVIQQLHHELQEHILIAERILQSRADYEALGNDGGDMEIAQNATEDRIQLLLKALQDVHLAVVQRNMASSGPMLEQVQNLLTQIDAQTEIEQPSGSTLKQMIKLKKAQSKKI